MESRRATTEQRRERTELDARFGKIGISAVAAALRYRSDAKNPAYAPVEPRESSRPRTRRHERSPDARTVGRDCGPLHLCCGR